MRLTLKTRVLLGLLLPSLLATATATADDKAACLDAATQGQQFHGAHKLVEAREQFRICAATVCPAVVQSDCAIWLDNVEKALPSVVLSAKNAAGEDRLDVKVSVDGQLVASSLDGRAVPMNAGLHAFHFETADGASFDEQVMVREGEQTRAVAVVLRAPASAPAPSTPTTPSPQRGGGARTASSPWKTVGWALGGAGVAGLGVGAVFGVLAMIDKNGAGCVENVCNPGSTSAIKSAALASDIGWIAGGVLVASGAALVLFAPSSNREPAANVGVAPTLMANGGGAVLSGRWW